MPYAPHDIRLSEEAELFYNICKWYLHHPTTEQEVIKELVQYLAPSWFFSNGSVETACEDWLLRTIIYDEFHGSIKILSQRLRCLHFFQLFVPVSVKERLMSDE